MNFGKREDLLTYDFQGWPIYRMSLRDIIENLGFEKMENEGNVYWRIADNNPIMEIRPRILHDDGMGYGVNEEYITEFSKVQGKEYINVFVDKKDEEYIKKVEEEYEKISKDI